MTMRISAPDSSVFGTTGGRRPNGDLNPRAIHVELPVPHEILPAPSQQRRPPRRIPRHGEVVALLQRAPADHALDHAESPAVVVRQRDLAGAAVVGGAAGEGEGLLGARGVGRGCADGAVVLVALAGEVGTGGEERGCHAVVDLGVGDVLVGGIVFGADGVGLGHLHVRVGLVEEEGEGGKEEGQRVVHLGGRCDWVGRPFDFGARELSFLLFK